MSKEISPSLAIVILNYKGSLDTISCVESLQGDPSTDFIVFVCDNDSADGSEEVLGKRFSSDPRVKVLQTGKNGGFAYGNNVGLRAALAIGTIKYFWILNNDTIVRAGAIKAMRDVMDSDNTIGILGATLVYHDRPEVIQVRGGSILNPWTSVSRHIGNGENFLSSVDVRKIEENMNFVSGASMFVSRRYLETVGLLSEQYFLYFEEADWVARNKGRFRLAYCPNAVIEHKEGASIGSSSASRLASPFSVYHICRSRLIFTRTHRLWALPTVVLRMLRYLAASIARRRWGTARAISCAMTGMGFR